MPMAQKTGHLYKFGPFLLDTAQQALSRSGAPVSLTPKTYDLLLVLVESHGRLLSKDELMRALWPNSFVEESNLTQQISMLRRVLGESAGEDRYIVTISGRGYRFAPAVDDEAPAALSSPADTAAEQTAAAESSRLTVTETRPPGVRWSRVLFPAVLVLMLAIVVLSYSLFRKQSSKGRHPGGPRTLAVLPFQSLRQDPANDFLG